MLSVLFDRWWKRLLWFASIPALTYLPSAVRLTYYRDDWYYAYDALVGPAGIFRALFASDRPARGPFFELYYALFGMTPLPYHLAMFFWRLIGGLACVWLFSLLWPRRRQAGLAAGLLFALYPGFTWWVSGIEYQPMVASAALMVVSLALTLQAVRSERSIIQWACLVAAVCTGWIYLSLVEYAAGLEVFRLCVLFVAIDSARVRTLEQKLRLAVQRWLPYLIIPVGFFAWRFLLFSSQRKATDLGAELRGFLAAPVSTGLHWGVSFLLSVINVTISAWILPLTSSFFLGGLRDVFLGLALALMVAVVGWFVLDAAARQAQRSRRTEKGNPPMEMLTLGLAGVVLGIIPVIVANREITFPNFSHYALPASLGLAFMIAGLVSTLEDNRLRTVAFAALVLLSAMTHQGLGASAVHEEQTIAMFWHQMAWRAPSIAPGTTLLAYYPNVDYADNTEAVWGPANYVYHPKPQGVIPVQVPISALTPDRASFNDILLGRDPQASSYRAHTMVLNYDAALIISQPAEDACVHVFDPRSSMLSSADDPSLGLLAPRSHLEGLAAAASPVTPPALLFGPEPAHAWCFYFEQAASAAQYGNWTQVAELQVQAGKLGLHPNDQIEWMPFLQAQAYLGDLQQVKEIATRINTEKLYKQQACRNLGVMAGHGYPLSTATQTYVNDLFCGG